MNKNIWAIVSPDETIPFRVIEPLHFSSHLYLLGRISFEASRWSVRPPIHARQQGVLAPGSDNSKALEEKNRALTTFLALAYGEIA
jgi:hypothetical protein